MRQQNNGRDSLRQPLTTSGKHAVDAGQASDDHSVATDKYSHIIDLPHHVSTHRPQMTMQQRAAQFAPFAAIAGHGAAISETARFTDTKAELSDSECDTLNYRLAMLLARLPQHPEACVTHFVPDQRKAGGHYAVHQGTLRSWDDSTRTLVFDDGTRICTDDIAHISPCR